MIAAKRHASIRANSARGSTAAKRRSDQDSRRMVGRWMSQALKPGIILRPCSTTGSRKLKQGRYLHGSEASGHTGRHEQALVAAVRHWSLRRTAWHVVRHLVCHRRRRNIVRHGHHRTSQRRLRHHGPGQRGQNETCNHKDRKEPAHVHLALHSSKFSHVRQIRKPLPLTTP